MTHAHDVPPPVARLALQATTHCLAGCGTGEVIGLAGATAFGFGNAASLAIGIVLAYVFGYALTLVPLVRAGMPLLRATAVTLAAETISITVMELVDNAVVVAVPGAMDAGLFDVLFWASLALSLVLAFVAAYPVNLFLVARGLGHAIAHGVHG